MLTSTTETTHVPFSTPASQNEKVPSDATIAARVRAIRAGWDLRERMERRRLANQRFERLLDVLQSSTHAA